MNYDYDLIIIGSGPGGYIAAIRAAQLGIKVACIEKDPTLGGTCLNVGCIPSKALLESSEHYDWIKKSSAEHGINAIETTLDFAKMMKRKEEIVHGLVNGVASLFKQNQITLIQGEAKFIESHILEVNNQKISGKNIIIATGSEPVALPFLPFVNK